MFAMGSGIFMRWIRFQSKALFDPVVLAPELAELDVMEEGAMIEHGGRFVAALLEERLPSKGFPVDYVGKEDWGWYVSLKKIHGYHQWIGCQYGFDDQGDYGLQCFVRPDKPIIWRWFRRIDIAERTAALKQAIEDVLRESGKVDGIYWTDEE
jgi:hypothetical protein